MRDDEPRPVWMSLLITHKIVALTNLACSFTVCHWWWVCLLLQDLVQRCLHGGGGDMGGHVLRETTSRGLCGLVCPSRVLLLQDLLQSCAHLCVCEVETVCVYVCLLLQDLVQRCLQTKGFIKTNSSGWIE
jgi:hypothetical protein